MAKATLTIRIDAEVLAALIRRGAKAWQRGSTPNDILRRLLGIDTEATDGQAS